jgi:imidazoleglycerol-phosphate dehydratase
MNKPRKATLKRKTTETNIRVTINLDGGGKAQVKTPIGFLNHMLALFAKHGLLDLNLKAEGDTEVDIHHTNEDIGICLGQAIHQALRDKSGIKRFGFASVPMDEALVEVTLDLSGRPYFKVTGHPSTTLGAGRSQATGQGKEYSLNYLKQFLQALVNSAGITMHVEILYGEDTHHIIEAVYKALGRALREAVALDPRIKGILSTKGRL